MNNIIITSAGRRVSLVKAFKKELKVLSPSGKVFVADAEPDLSSAAQVADQSFKLPLLSSNSYITTLLKVCKDHKVKIIIPTIDTELLQLAEHKELFINQNIIPIISSIDLIKICNNKRATNQLFNYKGIKPVEEYTKTHYKLPLFIKPINGSGGVDNHIIKLKNEISTSQLLNTNLMFSKYIDLKYYEEYTCDLYYDKNSYLKCVVPRKRIAIRAGEVSKGVTKKNSLISYIKKHLEVIEGAIGCITIQFFMHKSDQKIYGIEINPRFGGGFPLSYLAGANYPKWIIEEYIFKKDIDAYSDWKNNLLMLRYDEEIIIEEYDD
ncbi:ATP-grasp domain-containing protein [Aquimarina intermedia]|uniref:Carbamoyl-phosphate synthase large subunit n=1 Tax=Aquimarina intermedia TaxID=350814 RepID=A0A5S5C2X0_9FLAO|nr:ATP-grasp domain-containing protein [Aquimarina intermedia]TYP72313.1 carbamoyl-phosphate synthase large subunit [Aquimarina intermedia]